MIDVILPTDDDLIIQDEILQNGSFSLVLSDTIEVTQEILIDKNIPQDAVSVTDAVSVDRERHLVFEDAVGLTEEIALQLFFNRFPQDAINTTDSTLGEKLITYERSVSDSLVVTDPYTLVEKTFLEDVVGVSDSLVLATNSTRTLNDSIVVTETILAKKGGEVDRSASDTIGVSDSTLYKLFPGVVEDAVNLADSALVELVGVFQVVFDSDGLGLTLPLAQEVPYSSISLDRFRFEAVGGGVPIQPVSVQPLTRVLQNGDTGYLESSGFEYSQIFRISGEEANTASSVVVGRNVTIADAFTVGENLTVQSLGSNPSTYTSGFDSGHVGYYVEISNGIAPGVYQIIAVLSPTRVTLDRPLPRVDPANGRLMWRLTTAVNSLHFELSNKATGNRYYDFRSKPIKTITGSTLDPSGLFYSQGIAKPRLESVSCDVNGVLSVVFDQPMLLDQDLVSIDEYLITGPTQVRITKAYALDPTSVALETLGLTAAIYTLRVNYSGTPKDEGANPIDPEYSTTTFLASLPERPRSVYTDKGPISKREQILQTGTGVIVNTLNEVTILGGSFNSSFIGKYLKIGPFGIEPTSNIQVVGHNITADAFVYVGDSLTVELNGTTTYQSLDGRFKILGLVTSSRIRLLANLMPGDPSAAAAYWEAVDPQNGLIADDPTDVLVTVNEVRVVPEEVRGLLGQVILPFVPSESDRVRVSYSWCPNPTVEIQGLNSPQFRLNSWNRNSGPVPSQHTYRYNNVLTNPITYESGVLPATLKQPKLRELHYRGFEREYTPTLNDPSTLILNSPVHKIAYPSTTRTLEETFVAYEATTLPENSSPNWVRKGAGSAVISSNTLVVSDNITGTYPFGQPLFWTQRVDLTFPHIYALSWRFQITSVGTLDGVFTGLSVGYSDETNAYVVGFLDVAGVKKIGFLRKDAQSPNTQDAWIGGLDGAGNPTGLPVAHDWSYLRSYRILRDSTGRVRLFVDGNVLETLRVTSIEAPTLQELNSPFDEIQGTFFGSLSRLSTSVSQWDFIRYTVIPTNPIQVSPSIYVDYEGVVSPEKDPKPWTPVGSYGVQTNTLSTLLLDSISASGSTSLGLISGSYRGFFRLEPLLTAASQVVVDAYVSMRSQTHGINPDGLMFAVNDGTHTMQVSFLADKPSPKISYGGGAYPENFDSYSWTPMGSAPVELVGKVLRITDALTGDGKVYYYEDLFPPSSVDRVVSGLTDYILEFRAKVISYSTDGSGFAGVSAQVFDGSRNVGLMLREVAGVKQVVFHSEGVPVVAYPYDWGTGAHTYRLVKDTSGDILTLFIDGNYIGNTAYDIHTASSGTAYVSFGSSTPSSAMAQSVVEWEYCNAWRVSPVRKYVGLWKGSDPNSLTGYHLPTKVRGRAQIVGNSLQDSLANFATVVAGDLLVVDYGPNKGTYEVATTVGVNSLTIVGTWPLNPSEVEYRILSEVDWTTGHRYRLMRDPSGQVSLFLDANTNPLFSVTYGAVDLPSSQALDLNTVSGGIPAIVFGSFSSENLEQSVWDYVRYGVSRSLTELKMVPHHQVLNQWNVMESPERLFTAIPHGLTSFKSSSTGIAPKDPYNDLLENPVLQAYTLLNEDTPLMPKTQAFELRRPHPVSVPIAGINNISNVLNAPGFTLNNAAFQYQLVVPEDLLYASLEVIEQETGETSLLAPAMDDVFIKGMQYQKEVCLTYDGTTLPEDVVGSPTPWVRESDIPAEVLATALSGVLTYRTVGSKTVYKNNTPLPDAIGLVTEVKFRMRLKDDATLGTGDTQVRFGVSAPGMTLALAFVTTPQLERLVLILDLNVNKALGAFSHDFLDNAFHTYRIIRDASAGTVKVSIDT